MTKGAFLLAVFAAVGWFAKEAWPYVRSWLDDRQARQRVERQRIERERSSTTDER